MTCQKVRLRALHARRWRSPEPLAQLAGLRLVPVWLAMRCLRDRSDPQVTCSIVVPVAPASRMNPCGAAEPSLTRSRRAT